MTDRKNKGYIPWHERVDEDLIKSLAQQFVKDVFRGGIRIRKMEVEWDENGNFDVSTTGSRIEKPDCLH